MNKQKIINKTAEFAKNFFEGESSGHDWWHTERVWKTAKFLAEKEKADLFVVEMVALLHDVADYKLNNGNETVGLLKVQNWLKENSIDECDTKDILYIIENMSFSKEAHGKKIHTAEGFVVQDADRLDAIGAIGIARVFATGSKRGQGMYNPNVKIKKFETTEEYRNYKTTSINHFYEKLFLLKDMMKTKTGKELAQKRHKFMEDYLEEFYEEWDCKY